jgi:signal peptidase
MKNKSINFILEKVKTMRHGAYWGLVTFLVVLAGITMLTGFDLPGSVRLFVVRSGSMEPAIPTGSLVVVEQTDGYEQNDVITYLTSADANARNANRTITHRIIEVRQEESGVVYMTKGDVNDVPDTKMVPANQVLGKVAIHIPYAGYPVAYAKTQMGFVVLVAIPAMLIIYSECVSLLKQVKEKMLASKQHPRRKSDKARLSVRVVPIVVNRSKKGI